MLPSGLLALLATSAHCWGSCPLGSPGPLLYSCSSGRWLPAYSGTWSYSSLHAGLYHLRLLILSSANLLRIHSLPSSKSLMKILNSVGPSTGLWSVLLVTGPQLDFMPLVTICWDQLFGYSVFSLFLIM